MPNRRTFFATAASGLAWMLGVKPLPKIRQYARKYRVMTDDGGFLVPAQFSPMIESELPLLGAVYVTMSHPGFTMEESCKARGVPYVPETEEEKDSLRKFPRSDK